MISRHIEIHFNPFLILTISRKAIKEKKHNEEGVNKKGFVSHNQENTGLYLIAKLMYFDVQTEIYGLIDEPTIFKSITLEKVFSCAFVDRIRGGVVYLY
tara:strand:+ start:108 stop:404 length:297 start_codon:yes stop_codon:yes gene_type:complete